MATPTAYESLLGRELTDDEFITGIEGTLRELEQMLGLEPETYTVAKGSDIEEYFRIEERRRVDGIVPFNSEFTTLRDLWLQVSMSILAVDYYKTNHGID